MERMEWMSHVLLSSLQVGLIAFEFLCAEFVHELYVSIVGKLMSLRIKP